MKVPKGGEDVVQRDDDLCCRCAVEVPNVVVVWVGAERRSAGLDEIYVRQLASPSRLCEGGVTHPTGCWRATLGWM